MSYSVILFDLDGMLTDPTEGITRSVQYALAKLGITAAPNQLRAFIGPPLLGSFMLHYSFDEPTARKAVGYYREYFSEQGIHENVLLPGVRDLLTQLRNAGRALCVVTSKPTFYSEQIISNFGVSGYFDKIIGSQMDLSDADKTTLVKRAIHLYPAYHSSDFVMVGDREHDIIGARNNGIDSIAVTYGAGTREELGAAGATSVVDAVEQLLDRLLAGAKT